jgi:hypothetical protein
MKSGLRSFRVAQDGRYHKLPVVRRFELSKSSKPSALLLIRFVRPLLRFANPDTPSRTQIGSVAQPVGFLFVSTCGVARTPLDSGLTASLAVLVRVFAHKALVPSGTTLVYTFHRFRQTLLFAVRSILSRLIFRGSGALPESALSKAVIG